MKKLFYLTGTIDSSFFNNEIFFLETQFDKIVVFTYKKNREIYQYNKSKIEIVDVSKNYVECLINFPMWILQKHVRDELWKNLKSAHGILKCAYAFLYGYYACKVSKILNRHMEQSNNDIYLYSFWLNRLAYVIALNNVNRNSKIKKIVSRAHGYDLYEERNRLLYLPFRKFIDENIDTIFFVSENGKKYFQSKRYTDSIQKSKKKVIYLGTYNVEGVSKKYKNKETIVIASCSSIIKIKRIDLIIDFIKMFPPQRVKWIHLGDGIMKNEMKILAERKLDCEFDFLGFVDNREVLNIYETEDVDFFINMSDSEGIPVSIMEAMSVGIPIIARNVGGISEIVTDMINGRLIRTEIVDEKLLRKLAKDILDIFSNEEKYVFMSRNARICWEQKFDAAKNNCKFIDDLFE